MKAYTYLVINNITHKWYYGVRYAKNCKIEDLGKTYFTSSESVKEDIKKYGIDVFSWFVRKTFKNIEDALQWEMTVLRRMNVVNNPNCYNQHCGKGFTVRYGDKNSSKRPEVRKKLSDGKKGSLNPVHSQHVKQKMKSTKAKKSIINIVLYDKFKISRQKYYINIYENYKNYVLEHNPKCTRIIKKIEHIINLCKTYKPKKYPSNRKKRPPPSEITRRKIGVQKGCKWYTSPDLKETKWFRPNELPPVDWIPGCKTKERIEKISNFSKNRKHTVETKEKMRQTALRRQSEKNQKDKIIGNEKSI